MKPFIFQNKIDSTIEVVIMAYNDYEAKIKLSNIVINSNNFKLI